MGALALACVGPAAAQQVTVSPAEPLDLGGTTYLATQAARRQGGTWSLAFDGPGMGLPAYLSISAFTWTESGSLYLSVDTPFATSDETIMPGDIVIRKGGSLLKHRTAFQLGLDGSGNIDALAWRPDGRLALSLDVPTELSGVVYEPADVFLEDVGGGRELVFDGSAAGLGPDVNVVGYDRDDEGVSLLVFDAPVTVGGKTFEPGQVASYDDGTWKVFLDDAELGVADGASALALPPTPGRVSGLSVTKTGTGSLGFSWLPSSASGVADYAVFEGVIGDFDSHSSRRCSTEGNTSTTLTPYGGARYYLIVPVNESFEGSYGRASTGAERVRGGIRCRSLVRLPSLP